MTARVDVPETSLHNAKHDPQEELVGGTQQFRPTLSLVVLKIACPKSDDPAFSVFVFLAPKCVCFKLFFGHG